MKPSRREHSYFDTSLSLDVRGRFTTAIQGPSKGRLASNFLGTFNCTADCPVPQFTVTHVSFALHLTGGNMCDTGPSNAN